MPGKDPTFALLESLFNLQRLSNALVDDSDALLHAAFDDVVAQLARLDPTAVALRYRKGRVDELVKRVERVLGDAYQEWTAQQRSALAGVGSHQAERATLHLKAVLGAGAEGSVASSTGLSVNYFKRIIDAEPFQGATLKEWAAEQKRKTVFRVGQQVKLGVANGETLGDIVRRVRGRSAGTRGKYVGGVMETTTREAEALVRTAVAEVNTFAQMGTYEANDDILEGYQLVVTLDGRTSPICVKWGLTPTKVYDRRTGPKPPFHWNCRTVTVPAVNWKALGMTPPPEGTRASATGQVAADMDFEGWLRTAPDSYAVELLGPARARLFKEGRVTLRELIKTDKGRVRLAKVAELAA